MSSRRTGAVAAAVTALGAAAAVHGCTIVNGLVVPGPDAAADTGAPVDAGPDTATCDHASVPASPPELVDDGTLEVLGVVRRISFDLDGDAGAGRQPLGFDLDGICTCPAEPSCVARRTACDDDRGRDNGLAVLVREAKSKGLDIEARTNAVMNSGGTSLLVRVEGYNGKADDAQVFVSLLVSDGLFEELPGGETGERMTPTYTDEDRWSVDPEDVRLVGGRSYTSLRRGPGYVEGYKVVVRTDHVRTRLAEGFTMALTDGVFVGTIVEKDGSFALADGQVAGRWPVSDALAAAQKLRDSETGRRLCELPTVFYESLKAEICNAADVAALPAADGKGAPCDAISAALRLELAPASLGPLRSPEDENNCPDAGLDDCNR